MNSHFTSIGQKKNRSLTKIKYVGTKFSVMTDTSPVWESQSIVKNKYKQTHTGALLHKFGKFKTKRSF